MLVTVGSLNIDHVYQVEEISRPGETIHTLDYAKFSGGKGLNQSVAAARAGAEVKHMGCIGQEGQFLSDLLAESGVDVSEILVRENIASGHAIIQVNRAGENSIFIYGGANQTVEAAQLAGMLDGQAQPGWVLFQNETSEVPEMMHLAAERGWSVAYNPAPMADDLSSNFPLDKVSVLFVNQLEGEELTGFNQAERIAGHLLNHYPDMTVVVTRGSDGAYCGSAQGTVSVDGISVRPVDTTGAGDTFIGYFMAGFMKSGSAETALALANRAAAVCVTRAGAAASIPYAAELDAPAAPHRE